MKEILLADPGKIITNGQEFRKRMILDDVALRPKCVEITEEEYQKRMEDEICKGWMN